MSQIELPSIESARPTRSVASLLGSESFVMGLLVGVAVGIRPQDAWAFLPMAVVAIRRHVGFKALALAAVGTLLPLVATALWHADALSAAATSLAYSRFYTHSLPFEVKLANATLKTLFFLAIDRIPLLDNPDSAGSAVFSG